MQISCYCSRVSTIGTLKLADPIIKDLSSCSRDTCTFMGLDTFNYPARGSFAATTSGDPPYCGKFQLIIIYIIHKVSGLYYC